MKKTIQYPYFSTDDKNTVVCQFVYPDGEMVVATMTRDPNNPDWQQLMEEFTEEQIQEVTDSYSEELKQNAEAAREARKQRDERQAGDALFAAKLELFEMDEIKDSKNRSLKSKIRKAKSISEAQIYASVLVMKELESGKK